MPWLAAPGGAIEDEVAREQLAEAPAPRLTDSGTPASIVNSTVPDGAPGTDESWQTVAVQVTPWPKTEGLVDAVSAVVVGALVTVSVAADEVADEVALVSTA